LGGNIGFGIFQDLDKMTADSWVVLELSSFQLIDLHKSPHISVTLMTTLDHLDYHKDEAEYVSAKTPISKFQGPNDFSIYNIDYLNSVKIGQQGMGKKIAVSKNDWTKPLRLRGDHNRENMAAAAAVAKILDIRNEIIEGVARDFKGLEHLLEEVATVKGVTYFDDSFSTVPETTIAAIKAFTEPMILIAGGSEKGSDFTELGKTISESKNIKAIILIGLMAERIDKAILNRRLGITRNLSNMSEIVNTASSIAKSGDVVVMSPAAASFDMFKSYKDRGDQFKVCVKSL
jgi:UDP-N-acetylmuramoylalanine--D-glutamate ligase